MIIKTTNIFDKWFENLKDKKLKSIIEVRLQKIILGNLGFWAPVGNKVFELKFDYGAGIRIYFMKKGDEFIVLLCGGDKSTQKKDIKKAQDIAKEI